MKTKKEIESYALTTAMMQIFCNVGEDDWPMDNEIVLDMLEKDEDTNEQYTLSIYEPYDNWSPERVLEELLNLAEQFKQAMLWAVEDQN